MNISYLNDICSALPGSVYWKDLMGRYLGANDYCLETCGMNSLKDLLGKTDCDLVWHKQSLVMRNNDLYIIRTGKMMTFKEGALLSDNTRRIFFSGKRPLLNNHGAIIGVIGHSLEITEQEATKAYINNATALNTANHQVKIIHKDTMLDVELPTHLFRCFLQILQGKTAKQIAANLVLSPKTIEHYIASIKQFLGCRSSKELIYYYSRQVL